MRIIKGGVSLLERFEALTFNKEKPRCLHSLTIDVLCAVDGEHEWGSRPGTWVRFPYAKLHVGRVCCWFSFQNQKETLQIPSRSNVQNIRP